MNSNVCKHSSDFSLFFKALISKDTDTGTPTEGAARNIFRSPTINTSVASICFHPHSYCNKRCAAPITLSPPASGPLGVHLPSSLLVHTNEVTRAWIALVEWFLCFFTRMEAACSELSATCNWGGGKKTVLLQILRYSFCFFAQCFHRAHVEDWLFTPSYESQHWNWLQCITEHDYYFQELTLIKMWHSAKKEENSCKLKWRGGILRG